MNRVPSAMFNELSIAVAALLVFGLAWLLLWYLRRKKAAPKPSPRIVTIEVRADCSQALAEVRRLASVAAAAARYDFEAAEKRKPPTEP